MRLLLVLLAACLAFSARAEVTFSKDVAPIIQTKCAQCHRPGEVAPFPFTNYEEVQLYATEIRRVVSERIMPPWKPVDGVNHFREYYGLSDDERQTILNWIDTGAAQGDPADLPSAPPVSDSPWYLGDPDLVLEMPEYQVPRAKDTYRCFVLPTGLSEDQFVNAVQALPGDRQSVHHVALFIDTTGQSGKLDGKDGQPGYTCFGGAGISIGLDGGMLGAWAPGYRANRLPEGIGIRLRGNARVIMQVHYHPVGRYKPDQTKVGIWFASKDSIKQALFYIPVLNPRFRIPAGAKDFPVRASFPIFPGLDGKIISVGPHMHLLGKTIAVDVQDRDGTKRPVIRINNWDFNWQGLYTLEDAMQVRAGATISVSSTYDNSADNPRNPNNPLKDVGWGEGTEDEMCVAFVGYVFDRLPAFLPLRQNQTGLGGGR